MSVKPIITQALAFCKKKNFKEAFAVLMNIDESTALSQKEKSDILFIKGQILSAGIAEMPKNASAAKKNLAASVELANRDALLFYGSTYFKDRDDLAFLKQQFEQADNGSGNARFYAEYARILHLIVRKDSTHPEAPEMCRQVIRLCRKSIKMAPEMSSPFLYLGRLYQHNPEMAPEGENPFVLAESYYREALKKGSLSAHSSLRSLSKKMMPEMSFDLMNVQENPDIFIENVKDSYAGRGFSLLLYGPAGSGKVQFAHKLFKEMNCSYKEISVLNFTDRGSVLMLEKDENGKNCPAKASLKSLLNRYMEEDGSAVLITDADRLFSLSLNANNCFEESRNIAALTRVLADPAKPVVMIADDVSLLPQSLKNAFLFRIGFLYMDASQKEAAYNLFFNFEAPLYLKRLGGLVVEDFLRVRKKAAILNVLNDNDRILRLLEEEAKFKAGGGSSYLRPDTGFDFSLINADSNLSALTEKLEEKSGTAFSMLVYGPPGTGKSYYLRCLADRMGLNTVEKTAAELFSRFQGEPAKNVARMFKEAEEKKAMIILDEAEELLKNREGSSESWKNDMVNAFLTGLESYQYPFACTTNFLEFLDKAVLRRFVFKIKFDYLTKEQCRTAFRHFFKLDPPEELDRLGGLTNGDFATVKKKAIVLDMMGDAEELLSMLKEESEKKARVRVEQKIDLRHFDRNFLNADMEMLDLFAESVKRERKSDFSMLVYGPPGTGKSLYLRSLADKLGYEIIERRVSDIISKWFGETEKNLAQAFAEAKDRKAFLIFDEIDSFLFDREGTDKPWYRQMVNEFLVQMENHPFPFAGTTNYISQIDAASRRRFTVQAEFGFLKPEQYGYIYEKTFGFEPLKDISKLVKLTPAIFSRVFEKAELSGAASDEEKVFDLFMNEAAQADLSNGGDAEDRTYEKLVIPVQKLYEKPISEMYNEVLKGFVKIIVPAGHGSGFFITKDGFILTNRHVVGTEKTVDVELFSGRRIPGEVLRTNGLDVALIKVSGENACTPMPLRREELNIGSTVFSMGNPSKHNQVLSKGAITRYTVNSEGYKRIEADNFSYGGVSGGPLMDECGNVVGINVEGWLDPKTGYKTKIGLAMQVPVIEALEALNITLKESKEMKVKRK